MTDTCKTSVAVCSAAAAVLFAAQSVGAQEVTLRASGSFQPDHTSSIAMDRFSECVASETDGAVRVDNFPANQLGGAEQQVDQVRRGSIFMAWAGPAFWTRVVPELEVLSLPFVLPDAEQAFEIVDGPVGQQLSEALDEQGVVALGWGDLGARHVTNSVRPIETVEDFEGLRLRMQPNEVHLETFRALGANPEPLDIAELFQALQQGVMDGQENPYSIILTNNFQEVQDHVSDSAHFYDYVLYVANKEMLEGLESDHQAAIRTCMDQAVEWQRDNNAAANEQALQELQEAGMEFTPISDEVREEIQAETEPVLEGVRERIGDELVDQVLEQAGVEQ